MLQTNLWKTIVTCTVGLSSILATLSYILNINEKGAFNMMQTFIPAICYDTDGNPSKQCFGGWFYRVHTKTAEENAAFAKEHGWNYVLLSSNVKSENARQLLINNTKAFREQDIAVHVMCLEDTFYIDDPTKAYDEISSILTFVNEQQLDIQGIHIDCEPHAREDWKTANNKEKNDIFNRYLKVIENGRKAIQEIRPNTTYSGAVAWWYSSLTKQKELEFGRGYDLVNEKRLDFIFPMIYEGAGGTVKKVISRSEDYITDRAATVIGIAVEEYEYNTFKNVTQEIMTIRGESDYFHGISVYSNHHYPDWN